MEKAIGPDIVDSAANADVVFGSALFHGDQPWSNLSFPEVDHRALSGVPVRTSAMDGATLSKPIHRTGSTGRQALMLAGKQIGRSVSWVSAALEKPPAWKAERRGTLETHPERPFLANDDIENKGLLDREIAKKRLSG
ncbi:MAG: hypothetical protein ABSH28_05075 [Acidobacteriota bacterium]